MASVLSVNVGAPRDLGDVGVTGGLTGIDKRPVDGPVPVHAPVTGGGLAMDAVCDTRDHGGPDQAVYAYAREDLDRWAVELGRTLPCGVFGENLTTTGLDLTGALIGERWLVGVGGELELEVSSPRIPCRTFATWLAESGWVKRFTERAVPGCYLRVRRPGPVAAGDPVRVVHRPGHGVSIGIVFRALTTEPERLGELVAAPELPADVRELVERRTGAPVRRSAFTGL